MNLLLAASWTDWARLVAVLGIFVFVLFMTYCSTRFIATYQKNQGVSRNIEVIETYRLTSNKCLQIVRVGNKHLVIAICRDTVEYITELTEDNVTSLITANPEILDFKEILDKAKNFKLKK